MPYPSPAASGSGSSDGVASTKKSVPSADREPLFDRYASVDMHDLHDLQLDEAPPPLTKQQSYGN